MHSSIFNNITNRCSNMMFKSEHVHKTEDVLIDFCINHCPHKDCKKGICNEYKEFEKQQLKGEQK